MHREKEPSLRRRAVEGSFYLSLRRAIGTVLSLAGLFLVTRIVGPDAYGLFAAALGVQGYLQTLGQMGVRVYLIRGKPDMPETMFHLAFTWLTLWGISLTLIAVAVFPFAGRFWIRTEGFTPVVLSLIGLLPIILQVNVPSAVLERRLEYKRTAAVEILGQLLFYGAAIPLAQLGYGVWALVAGFWSSQLTLAVGFFWAARYRPRWFWDRAQWRDMFHYSFTQALSGWIYDLRHLAPSLILLPLAGQQMVGYYALAQRLLQMLGFAREAVSRVSLPLYGRMQDQTDKLLYAIYRSAQAQILGLGIACLGFAMLGAKLLPVIFGAQWDIPNVMWLFAILASEQTLSAIFGAHAQALQVRRYNMVIVRLVIIEILLFSALGALLTALAPAQWKGVGFAFAFYIAHLPANWLYDRIMRRYVGRPLYGMNLLWAVALSVALFVPVVGYWALLALGIFLLPASRREIRQLLHELQTARRAETA